MLGIVRNHTQFGRDLAAFSKENIRIVSNGHGFECGWLDGGCLIFAKGLSMWSMGEMEVHGLCATENNRLVVHHAICLWQDKLCIDAEGVCSKSEIPEKWRDMEEIGNSHLLPWKKCEPFSRIPFSAGLSIKLADSLRKKFGLFDEILFDDAIEKIGFTASRFRFN